MALSIVIPAFNEEAFIKNTITRIVDVIGNKIEFEIIVVDNASTDKTPIILQNISGISVLTLSTKQTVAAVRNYGWKKARFPLLAFIDGDMLITPAWMDAFIATQQDMLENPLQVTGCRVALSEQPSWLENAWFGSLNPAKTGQKYINSGNLLTTDTVMEKIDGFDESLITGEDVDFCSRATLAGAFLKINYNFVAHHEGYPKTVARFFKRERWHGIGDVKSLTTFLQSRVALFSFAIISLSIAGILLLLMNQKTSALTCFFLVILLNSYAVYTRFQIDGLLSAARLFYLQFLYALARFLSLLDRNKV